MAALTAIYNALSALNSFLWGIPILVVLVGGGIVLTFFIGGVQFRRFGFIMKNTVGTLFDRERQRELKAKGVTPFQAVTAALSGTIGTGNIAGVGAAIAIGGPGALFWMWVCGFLAMSIKFSEVTLCVAYRKKNPSGEGYLAGPLTYMRDGLGSKSLGIIFSILSLITLTTIAGVHSGAITDNLETVGVPRLITCIICLLFVIIIAAGGMKRLIKVTDKLVPAMSLLYIACALIVILVNITHIGTALKLIFAGAFTGQAAAGGFTGAAVSATIRIGLARGVFSNDAGLGMQATMHAQAEGIEHPAQQGMWGIFETFLDTVIICSCTGFMIIFTGVWQTGASGSTLAASAIGSVLGPAGQYLCLLSLILFAFSSLITISQTVRIQSVTLFNSNALALTLQAVILLMIIGGALTNMDKVFMFTDLGNALVICLNLPSILLLGKQLRKLTKEWFDSNGRPEALKKE